MAGSRLRVVDVPREGTLLEAVTSFLRRGQAKNLSPHTLALYRSRLEAFTRYLDSRGLRPFPAELPPDLLRDVGPRIDLVLKDEVARRAARVHQGLRRPGFHRSRDGCVHLSSDDPTELGMIHRLGVRIAHCAADFVHDVHLHVWQPSVALPRSLTRSAHRINDQSGCHQIAIAPGFVVAKGGITAIEIARSALRARRAEVRGHVASGVPVWRLGTEARWADLPYVVFPGNVGTSATLRDVVRTIG